MVEMPDKPLVTFALMAYNQERYIAEAVTGALEQDYSPLEIVLSDDCSTDLTFNIMSKIAAEYDGPHSIVLNRNTHNLGIGGHAQVISSLVSGEIVLAAAGDDRSHSQRAVRCVEAFQEDPNALVFVSAFSCFDANSQPVAEHWEPIPEEYSLENFARGLISVHGAAAAWRRSLGEGWPTMQDVIHEDRVLPFRALLLGGTIASTRERLVNYRSSGGITRINFATFKGFPPDIRKKALERFRPDAVARLNDFNYFNETRGITPDLHIDFLLRKTIQDIDEEIAIINSGKFLSYFMYINFMIRTRKTEYLVIYLKSIVRRAISVMSKFRIYRF